MRNQDGFIVAVITFSVSCVAREQSGSAERDIRYDRFKQVETSRRGIRNNHVVTERRLAEEAGGQAIPHTHAFARLLLQLRPTSPLSGRVSPLPAHEQRRSTPMAQAGAGQNTEVFEKMNKFKNVKKISYSNDARKSLFDGLDKVANAVKVTLGPIGRNVAIQTSPAEAKEADVIIINDGVSIASWVELVKPEEQTGAKLLLDACAQTDSRAGDGTTTAAVLAQAICKQGQKLIRTESDALAIQRGIIRAAAFFGEKIREKAEPVTTLLQYEEIATLSARDEDIGEIIAEAVMRVGSDGAVTTQVGKQDTDTLEFAEGLEHPLGMIDDVFATDEGTTMFEMDNARIFVTDQKLESMQDILPILEGVLEKNEPLVILSPYVTGEALAGLKLNMEKGVIKVCVVKTPGFGDVRSQYLGDICTFSGAKFCTSALSMKPSQMTLADCGKVAKAIITKDKFTILSDGTQTEEVEKRVDILRNQYENMLMDGKEFEVQRLEQRIQKLRGAVAHITIGGYSEAEKEDKKLRYEDAINALRGACLMGRVPGGGATYVYMLRYADELKKNMTDKNEKLGVDVLTEAMKEPCRLVSNNANFVGEMTLQNVTGQEWGYGFNAATGEYCNMIEEGVCDPASVAVFALENAASVAGTLLTTEALVTLVENPADQEEYRPEVTSGIDTEAAEKAAW